MTGWISVRKKQQWKNAVFMAGKLSVACILSILLAYELGLKYCATAGVITILSIQGTKVDTIQTAFRRLIAFFASLLIAAVSFAILGYTLRGFGCYLFFFVFVCMALRWEIVMSVNVVLVSHILDEGVMTVPVVCNEATIFLIGIGMGILVNLHLRKDMKMLKTQFGIMDEEMRRILRSMADRMLTKESSLNGTEEFQRLEMQMQKAEEIAWNNHHNTVRERLLAVFTGYWGKQAHPGETHWDVEYVKMRKKQCEILYEMHKKITQLRITPVQAEHIAAFLEKMSEEYHEENDVKSLLKALEELRAEMKATPLPVTREEFESRAILFVFLLDINEFLSLKNAFYRERQIFLKN